MTVAELIKALEKMPPDNLVVDSFNRAGIEDVEEHSDTVILWSEW